MSLRLTLEEVCSATEGSLLQGSPSALITGVSNDSRSIQTGSLFVALVAERDGHDFVPSALNNGASALLVQRPVKAPADVAVIQVADTFRAMGDLAAYWRQRFSIPIIAVTGSNGKTSTKEILASLCQQHAPTLSTAGNFNNLLGLPLTLYRLGAEHHYAILEMGMNAPGEIARLAEIAKPQIGMITLVTAAHLEGLGTVENVAAAKGELFDALTDDDVAIVQADDPYVLALSKAVTCRKIYVTSRGVVLPPDAEVIRGTKIQSLGSQGSQFCIEGGLWGSLEVQLPLLGRHQVDNALCAVAAAHLLGLPAEAVIQGMAAVQPAGRRSRLLTTEKGVHLLDDCYNSNPASACAGMETLLSLAEGKPTIAVLGDMLEMGAGELELHAEVGEYAAEQGIERLLGFGPRSKAMITAAQKAGLTQAQHFEDIDALWNALQPHLQQDVHVLVKGSRGMRLERISRQIEEEVESSNH